MFDSPQVKRDFSSITNFVYELLNKLRTTQDLMSQETRKYEENPGFDWYQTPAPVSPPEIRPRPEWPKFTYKQIYKQMHK